MKVTKAIFGADDSHYREFWPHQAELCKKILNIEPVLFWITNEDSDFYDDGFGIVKKIKAANWGTTGLQSTIVRFWAPSLFPDDICILCDIDMFMLNREYFIDQLLDFSEEDLVIMISDTYDSAREEMRDFFKINSLPFSTEMYPVCYNVGKGTTFQKVMNLRGSFEEFLKQVNNRYPEYTVGWYIDEFYFSDCVNNNDHGIQIQKLKRGVTSTFQIPKRIEKWNFPDVIYDFQQLEIDRQRYGVYDDRLLQEGHYIDCHCVRPYHKYKQAVDRVAEIALRNTVMDKTLIMITSYCPDEKRKDILRNLVTSLSKNKHLYDIMVVSHTVIPDDVAQKVDFALYDKKNEILSEPEMLNHPWFAPTSEIKVLSSFLSKKNTHLAIWRMMILGFSLAKNAGYEKVHHIEYDSLINDPSEIIKNSMLLDSYDTVIYSDKQNNVEEIMFGTYQAVRVSKLDSKMIELDEEWIKTLIRHAAAKSPEGLLKKILTANKNVITKDRWTLETKENTFGRVDGQVGSDFIPWAVPYWDGDDDGVHFMAWNNTKKEPTSIVVIVNDEKVLNIKDLQLGHWRTDYLCKMNELRTIIVLENKKLRDTFIIENSDDVEKFQHMSFKVVKG